MAVVDLTFPRSYEVSLGESERVVHFPREFEHTRGVPGEVEWSVGDLRSTEAVPPESGFAVSVRPERAAPWCGIFSAGTFGGTTFATGVYTSPDPDRVVITSGGTGYWVRADDPDEWEEVRCLPVKTVHPAPDAGLIVFADFTSLVAYGSEGLRWETERLGWDDLKVEGCASSATGGVVWEAPTDQIVRWRVDLETGRHDGGADFSMMQPLD